MDVAAARSLPAGPSREADPIELARGMEAACRRSDRRNTAGRLFEAAFLSWVRGLTEDFAREVVAIGGKTIRGPFDRGRAHKAVAGHFARTCFDIGGTVPAFHDAFDDTHGRLFAAGSSPALKRPASRRLKDGLACALPVQRR